ncbi:hypothetical protein BSLA_02f4499 [Burkholderia stabilis]|nr:hypothetical protein BSLA_02f4499 [Burkholderia stabilis]
MAKANVASLTIPVIRNARITVVRTGFDSIQFNDLFTARDSKMSGQYQMQIAMPILD